MKGSRGLERRQRNSSVPQDLLHIPPGSKRSFAGNPLFFIEKMIENLNSEVRHSHFINIRKSEAEFHLDPGRILSDGMDLLTKVPDRFRNKGKKLFQSVTIHSNPPVP